MGSDTAAVGGISGILQTRIRAEIHWKPGIRQNVGYHHGRKRRSFAAEDLD